MNYSILKSIACLSIAAAVIVFGCSGSGKTGPSFEIKIINAGKGAGSIESADFNKDGFPDLAVANAEDSSITILLANGKGNFTEAQGSPFRANRFPNDISIADLDNDGNLDLAIANTEVSMLTVLWGNGKGEFVQAVLSPYAVHSKPHTHGVAVGDFNGDGYLDLATDSWGQTIS